MNKKEFAAGLDIIILLWLNSKGDNEIDGLMNSLYKYAKSEALNMRVVIHF